MLFNEPKLLKYGMPGDGMALPRRFSALQRAEIAEIWVIGVRASGVETGFSALQRAEIAEIGQPPHRNGEPDQFQCSSTSRNC